MVSYHFPGREPPSAGVGMFEIQHWGLHSVACIPVGVPQNSRGTHTVELTLFLHEARGWMTPPEHQPHLAARFLSDENTLKTLRRQAPPMMSFQDDRLFVEEQEYVRCCLQKTPPEQGAAP